MKLELTRKDLNTLTENAASVLQNNLPGESANYTGKALLAAAATELSPAGLRKAAREMKAAATFEKDRERQKTILAMAKADMEIAGAQAALYAHWARIYRKLCEARLPAAV